MAVSAILADPAGDVHARYGINLCGSALGCLLVFFILGPLTGPEALVVCAIVAALLGVTLCARKAIPLVVTVAVGVPVFVFADELIPYQIQKAETAGQLALIEQTAAQIAATNPEVARVDVVEEFDRWDPTARVQVHALDVETDNPTIRKSLEQLPSMWFTQDSSYGSPLIGRGENPEGVRGVYERTLYGAGYFRGRAEQDVLVIGLGGAPDIQTALHHESASVTGVDINATTVEMVRSHLDDFLGKPYEDPRVTIHLQDGRSYVRSSEERYDLIQLSGVDTKSVLATGTLALNESYLYTREAFDEYLGHLAPDGILCIMYAGDVFRHRLAITVMDSLEREGAEHPEHHLMMLGQSAIFCMLVKKTPFTEEDTAAMERWLLEADASDGAKDGSTGVVVWVYELLNPGLSLTPAPQPLYLPHRPTSDPLMTASLEGRRADFIANHVMDLSPAPDWRPFFFNTVRNEVVWSDPPAHFVQMFRLLAIMLVLGLVLILGPLTLLGMRGMRAWVNLPFAGYFAALGAGYIMAMSGLIQRYVLFLGHQSYAFAVVIGGLLVAAGIGSFIAGRFQHSPRRVMTVAVVAICVLLGVIQLALDPLLSVTAHLGLPVRVGLALLVLLPLGIPLGAMFPTGLAMVRKSSPVFVPWAFGINGVFSVVGTTLVLPGAILYGFPTMAAAAGLVYVLALAIGLALTRR